MAKKKKFDLTDLVHQGALNEGQKLVFVSDPSQFCTIVRLTTGEYKVSQGKETLTIHAFATKCLGTEPPIHASKWLKTEKGEVLFDLWHAGEDADAA